MMMNGEKNMVMDMTDEEFQMFGISEETIQKDFVNGWTARAIGIEMTAMQLLSDAQEVMARGDTERARKWINIAKYLLSESLDSKRKDA